jgi:hypothetical protein
VKVGMAVMGLERMAEEVVMWRRWIIGQPIICVDVSHDPAGVKDEWRDSPSANQGSSNIAYHRATFPPAITPRAYRSDDRNVLDLLLTTNLNSGPVCRAPSWQAQITGGSPFVIASLVLLPSFVLPARRE